MDNPTQHGIGYTIAMIYILLPIYNEETHIQRLLENIEKLLVIY